MVGEHVRGGSQGVHTGEAIHLSEEASVAFCRSTTPVFDPHSRLLFVQVTEQTFAQNMPHA